MSVFREGILSLFIAFYTWVSLVKAEVFNAQWAVPDKWNNGFRGTITFPADREFAYGWLLYISFDIVVHNFEVHEGIVIGVHPSNKIFVAQHKDYNRHLYIDSTGRRILGCQGECPGTPQAEVMFIPMLSNAESVENALKRALGLSDGSSPSSNGGQLPTTTTTTQSTTTVSRGPWWTERITTATNTPTTRPTTARTAPTAPPNLATRRLKYNLRDVITKSLLFFEAQRSGHLPPNNRIQWRSHSALRDGEDHGIDLSGGYYNDGGYVKCGFPMAFTTTQLAWSLLEFRNAYLASHQIPHIMNAIKWATDYFIKCHVSEFEFYGQVSNKDVDDEYWGRPEDFTGSRPSYKITQSNPGSDLAAETAAALAASAIVFNNTASNYSSILLHHARQLFDFAQNYTGAYHESIPQAETNYKSWSGYWDELSWAAAWLYKATGESRYLTKSMYYLENNPDRSRITTFSWDDKRAGATFLLAQITNEYQYISGVSAFCDAQQPGSGPAYTPKGLLYISEWGPNRHAANVGFLCLLAAKIGISRDFYQSFAYRQLSYILGNGGRSYVVGFGNNPPDRPFHRASSCPPAPALCTWDNKDFNGPNPQVLTGAMVAGPDRWDTFTNDRSDSKHNSVAIDFNSALQALAAGILEIQVTGQTFSEPNPEELLASISETFSVRHDYGEVLRKSLLFYEAQRSGELPANNRVLWRKSAFVDDRGLNGEGLSGGYFDAGDYVKFNLPMAFTTTVLSWGVLAYADAYNATDQLAHARSAIKWATDYFIKCHVKKYEYYAQVGEGVIDHLLWRSPPRNSTRRRRAFKLTTTSPGTEVVAETAAAMAAASVVFRSVDPSYSQELLRHARDLYDFGNNYREVYHRSIRDVQNFYRSYSGYKDELAWAATWLYFATGEQQFLTDAQAKYNEFNLDNRKPAGFHWDDKTAGVQLLLAQMTSDPKFNRSIEQFCDRFLPGGDFPYTPKGLVFIQEWGVLRHAAGVAFICMGAANLGVKSEIYRDFAKRQIHYMLGDSGLGSYVIGYGPSPPTRPHHRSSSCPIPPAPCSFEALRNPSSNPHVLTGALVGGPDGNDRFTDDRRNHRSSEVALDYNAAFQSAIAGLKYLELYPPYTPTTPNLISTVTTPLPTYVPPSFNDTDYVDIDYFSLIQDADILGELDLNLTVLDYNLFQTTASTNNHTATTAEITSEEYTTKVATTELATTLATTTELETTKATTLPSTTAESTSTQKTTMVISTSSIPTTTTSTTISTTTSTTTATTTRRATINPPRIITLLPTRTISTVQINQGQCSPFQVFNACAAQGRTNGNTCRYSTFRACAARLGASCTSLWSTWSEWNNNHASDQQWFSEEEIACNSVQVDRQNCQLLGLTSSFEQCLTEVDTRPTVSTTKCRWKRYQECVNRLVGHCALTWQTWDLWNSKDTTPKFTKTRCKNSSIRTAVLAPVYVLLSLYISFHMAHQVF